ncbi:hypothetical protein PHYBLDRAFT_148478 [Phycomyces blakesleeanus NRRL 1555(-)]|uniref:Uncharacterized protein n=1 Tax=Phycomyces blakesleeanus (strain ATCC 8743b / DSM 1359 / FGSC 10004 / NBRC 33097 / NRRL 1555) TaxID=763407 RepID=A0A162WRR9_PHYB8|nr:hypothetical protein PHYBLDRAFT_148478 [Phycomyces blakesleeanus NRRL 1555(-)]OAD70565.1 hypothetical protein PHYBLDRAFT_148478 [Phycomyces blakesleeanus NRRL 1555(-)]|eukprot:XP_018288605.1 hypothetical protein PHYBLDRAFT_148478 [Phycomyces blakesleeanus NRRL 1555(-)]
MNNTDNNSISLLHAMYNEILSLKAGQEKAKLEMKAQIKELKLEMKMSIKDLNLKITALQSQLENRNISNQHTSLSVSTISSTNIICKPVSTFHEIALKHIFKMISEDLGIEVTSNEKVMLNMCTKLVCDDMAAHSSVIALGPNPSWGSIPTSLGVLETEHQLQELHISGGTAIKDYSLNETLSNRRANKGESESGDL